MPDTTGPRGRSARTERASPVAGVEDRGTAVVVTLRGELDLYNADELRAALLAGCARGPERLVVDLGQVRFVDSTALGVLIEARSRLRNRRSLVLAAARLETRRALEISGLDRHFTLRETVADALDAPLADASRTGTQRGPKE